MVGLGGLGHMALKLAHALGADVTLFTRSLDKEQDARRLGAERVVLSADEEHMASVLVLILIVPGCPCAASSIVAFPLLTIPPLLVIVIAILYEKTFLHAGRCLR